MQLQANNEQDRIMDPESTTHSPVKGTVKGICCWETGQERKEKVGRGLQKIKVYILNKYTLMLPSQVYVSPELNTTNIAIEAYCIYKCSRKTRQHKLGRGSFFFFCQTC